MSLDWTFVHCKWSHTHTMVTKQSQSEDDCVCVCKTLQCDDRLRCLLSSFHLLPAPVSIIVRRMSGEGAHERVARDETWGCVQSALHTTIWYRKYPGNMSRAELQSRLRLHHWFVTSIDQCVDYDAECNPTPCLSYHSLILSLARIIILITMRSEESVKPVGLVTPITVQSQIRRSALNFFRNLVAVT